MLLTLCITNYICIGLDLTIYLQTGRDSQSELISHSIPSLFQYLVFHTMYIHHLVLPIQNYFSGLSQYVFMACQLFIAYGVNSHAVTICWCMQTWACREFRKELVFFFPEYPQKWHWWTKNMYNISLCLFQDSIRLAWKYFNSLLRKRSLYIISWCIVLPLFYFFWSKRRHEMKHHARLIHATVNKYLNKLWFLSLVLSRIMHRKNICGFNLNFIFRSFWVFWYICFQYLSLFTWPLYIVKCSFFDIVFPRFIAVWFVH